MPYKDVEERKKCTREWMRKWREKNHELVIFKQREWRKKHPDYNKNYMRKYYEKHKNEAEFKNRNNIRGLCSRTKLTMEVLVHYGGNPPKCICCNETEFLFLSIDHINSDGAEHRQKIGLIRTAGYNFYRWLKKNNYPEGYQVLCMNCNHGKMRNKGVCPHKLRK